MINTRHLENKYSDAFLLQRNGVMKMAKDRITPCLYYVCKGECKKGRESDHNGYCQRCDKYKPRVKERHKNLKKEKLEKIRKNDMY